MNNIQKYVITDIKYRPDALYFKDVFPDRIKSTVELGRPPRVGHSVILDFVSDEYGNKKTGLIVTGIILSIEEYEDIIILNAIEGIYTLQKKSN